MDLSDGLSTDLKHLCEASAVGAQLDPAAIPLAPGATLDHALHGGEDYELVFTAPARIPKTIAGIPITCIGEVTSTQQIKIGTKTLKAQGWQHLKQ